MTGSTFGEHRYLLRSEWTGNRGTGTSGYRDYDRSVSLLVDGKDPIAASADRPSAATVRNGTPKTFCWGAFGVPPAVVPPRVRRGGRDRPRVHG
jgi:hypothetical protein